MDDSSGLPSGVMVTIADGNLVPVSFEELADPQTKRTRIRQVDVESYAYQVARAYQIRLERADLENQVMLNQLAAVAKMPPAEFHQRYLQAATRLPDDTRETEGEE